jgi:hypothetical protein
MLNLVADTSDVNFSKISTSLDHFMNLARQVLANAGTTSSVGKFEWCSPIKIEN